MRLQLLTALAVLAILTGAAASSVALEITTDATTRYQTMEGWGTNERDVIMDTTAARNAYRDLGLNIFRINLDFRTLTPVQVNGQNDYRVRIPLIGNTLQQNVDKFDFDLFANEKRGGQFSNWLSQNALEPDRVKIVGSVWTPPHWMKGPTGASQSYIGSAGSGQAFPTPWMAGSDPNITFWGDGEGDSIGGRLRTEDATNLTEYGEYMAAHVTAFEQEFGVDLYALSIQNESTFENPFISMVLDKNQFGNDDFNQYAMALNSVRQAWQTHGLDTKIKAPHVAMSGQSSPSSPFRLTDQMAYINGIKNFDSTLIDFVDFYNTNGYVNADAAANQLWAGYYHGKDNVAAPWPFWAASLTGVKQDGKGIWQSETGNDSGSVWRSGGSNPGAMGVALKIFNAVVHADTSAYIYWQFIDGSNPEEYSLVGINQLGDPDQSMKYSAFKHFSRYVRPGAERIDATFANGFATTGGANEYDALNGVNVATFLHEEDATLTYVLLNMESTSQSITINLPDDLTVGSFEAFRSSNSERFDQLADLVVGNDQVTFSMPANSLMTLVGDFLAGIPGDFDGDGDVDVADVMAIQRDGTAQDVAAWQSAFTGSSVSDAAVSRVPEPQTMVLLSLMGCISASVRRRAA